MPRSVSFVAHHDTARSGVSGTAVTVCALRAEESAKPERRRLVFDPLASVLCGGCGPDAEWIESTGRSREFWIDFMAVRTRWIDDAMALAPPKQLVILGAGLDCRAYRLEALRGVPVFEVDFGEVLEAKQLSHVPANLGVDDLQQALLAAGFHTGQPSVWLLEGLTGYLTEPELAALLESVAAASVEGSTIIATFVGAEMRATSMHRFSVADESQVAAVLGAAGWAAAEVQRLGAVSRGYGRDSVPPEVGYFLASAARE
ncbi:unnamed protein product [Prorocentrum cordatum]|uniref:S-adenosyl-L-methionine-dependent methyltransferase n=1 Tax=Prorocentrum cordatum TaxID=2364126 RepID=A0ABN9S7V4_9DINO|nr:unnamed protein product [Polarella glacialis]